MSTTPKSSPKRDTPKGPEKHNEGPKKKIKISKFQLELSEDEEEGLDDNATPKSDMEQCTKVIHIKPNLGKKPIEAFTVSLLKWNQDRAMCNPILIPGLNNIKKQYLDEINCVHRMITIVGPDNTCVGQTSRGGGFFSRKCLVFCFQPEMMTEDKIREFVNGTLHDAVWEYRHAKKGTDLQTKKAEGPHMREGKD